MLCSSAHLWSLAFRSLKLSDHIILQLTVQNLWSSYYHLVATCTYCTNNTEPFIIIIMYLVPQVQRRVQGSAERVRRYQPRHPPRHLRTGVRDLSGTAGHRSVVCLGCGLVSPWKPTCLYYHSCCQRFLSEGGKMTPCSPVAKPINLLLLDFYMYREPLKLCHGLGF